MSRLVNGLTRKAAPGAAQRAYRGASGRPGQRLAVWSASWSVGTTNEQRAHLVVATTRTVSNLVRRRFYYELNL
jgi:hypothetical protein